MKNYLLPIFCLLHLSMQASEAPPVSPSFDEERTLVAQETKRILAAGFLNNPTSAEIEARALIVRRRKAAESKALTNKREAHCALLEHTIKIRENEYNTYKNDLTKKALQTAKKNLREFLKTYTLNPSQSISPRANRSSFLAPQSYFGYTSNAKEKIRARAELSSPSQTDLSDDKDTPPRSLDPNNPDPEEEEIFSVFDSNNPYFPPLPLPPDYSEPSSPRPPRKHLKEQTKAEALLLTPPD